nr:hypothetical protein [Mycobacterium sp. E3298]
MKRRNNPREAWDAYFDFDFKAMNNYIDDNEDFLDQDEYPYSQRTEDEYWASLDEDDDEFLKLKMLQEVQ